MPFPDSEGKRPGASLGKALCFGRSGFFLSGEIPLESVRDSVVSFLGYARQAQAAQLMRNILDLEAF